MAIVFVTGQLSAEQNKALEKKGAEKGFTCPWDEWSRNHVMEALEDGRSEDAYDIFKGLAEEEITALEARADKGGFDHARLTVDETFELLELPKIK